MSEINTENTTTGEAGNLTADSGNATTPQQEGKTFTQDDVNRIISERLAKEKAKADAALAAREQEIAAREFQLKAKEIMESKKLPVELLGALNATDESSLNKALDILDEHFNFSNPTQAYILNPDGKTWRKPTKEDRLTGPTGGLPSGLPDHDGGIRAAMGLHK